MTFKEAANLKQREAVIDRQGKRWYVNGAVRLWITRPRDIRVPIKHGLYKYSYITQDNLREFRREDAT